MNGFQLNIASGIKIGMYFVYKTSSILKRLQEVDNILKNSRK
jgi:hypothetical protein